MRRLEAKDVEAFERVIGATDHPTEAEFINICQESYRDFEPRAKEDLAPAHLPQVVTERDIRSNTIRLWRAVWRRGIKIDEEITKPVAQRVEQDWHDYAPSLKAELSQLGKTTAGRAKTATASNLTS